MDAAVRAALAPPGRLIRRPGALGTIAALLAIAAIWACWWTLAPPRIGGKTSVAVVDGTSMLPRLRRGDLVVVRASSRYAVGDIVAYRSSLLDRVVLHRIVKIERGRYTFKGDNNTWLDPETPTRSAIIGKKWLQLPKVGSVSSALRNPVVAALLMGGLVLVGGLGGARPARSDAP